MQDGHVVRANGTQEWRIHGQLHREGDQPARKCADGTQEWYLNGKLHREGDQPAVIFADGTRVWWRNGQLHRDGDQPAVIRADGMQAWWTHGAKTCEERVTDFRETSDRFAFVFVRAVACTGTAACEPCDTGSAVVGGLLQTVHALPCDASSSPSYHVAHEHAFLVALFL